MFFIIIGTLHINEILASSTVEELGKLGLAWHLKKGTEGYLYKSLMKLEIISRKCSRLERSGNL